MFIHCYSSVSKRQTLFSSAYISSGYTLLELIIVIAIVGILTSLTLPGLSRYLEQQRADVTSTMLRRAITTTRSTAISSREIVSLCPYEEQRCGEHWENGMMIFIDKNNNGMIDDNETLYEKISWQQQDVTIRWRASGGKNYLRYSPSGAARQFGRFHICHNSGDLTLARALVINRQGRVRPYRDRNGDSIVEDVSGDTPACT